MSRKQASMLPAAITAGQVTYRLATLLIVSQVIYVACAIRLSLAADGTSARPPAAQSAENSAASQADAKKAKAKKAAQPEPPPHPLVGQKMVFEGVDWEHPVYATTFDDAAVLKDWRLEGGKRMSVVDGKLVLESEASGDRNTADADHLVCWLTKEMPGNFLLEFSVHPQNRKNGLNIVFFNARGIDGESIFDPSLKPRNGVFKQYHSGDLNCYHISYWAGDRSTANVRKNHGFDLVAVGKDLVADGPADGFQTVRLYKRGGTIRLTVDDVVSVAFDDDGQTFGPVWNHSGWIGLRQMAHTGRCEYDHLRVLPLRQ
ncbi:MAG: DUF1961 family protein [Planctomycetota bacterium]